MSHHISPEYLKRFHAWTFGSFNLKLWQNVSQWKYDSVSDIGWTMGAQKGYFRWFRKKGRPVLRNLLKHGLSLWEKITKNCKKKNYFFIVFTTFDCWISSKHFFCDALKVWLYFVIKKNIERKIWKEKNIMSKIFKKSWMWCFFCGSNIFFYWMFLFFYNKGIIYQEALFFLFFILKIFYYPK